MCLDVSDHIVTSQNMTRDSETDRGVADYFVENVEKDAHRIRQQAFEGQVLTAETHPMPADSNVNRAHKSDSAQLMLIH